MSSALENNALLFWIGIVVAIGTWIYCYKVRDARYRRPLRASTIFLSFPIVYLGHPFLYYQSWMFLVVYISELNFFAIGIYLLIWIAIVGLSLRGADIKNEQDAF